MPPRVVAIGNGDARLRSERRRINNCGTFGYTYAEIPLVVDASTRGKPADGVLSKYYGVLPSG
ncbi:MAG: hypothetical protein V3U45_05460 [bacterium]